MAAHVTDSIFFKDLYGSPEMRAVFDDYTLLQKWLDYEAALARAEASLGLFPDEAATEISRKARAELMDTDAIKQGVDKTASDLARKYRDTVMAGRTHAQQALPITFGFKVAVWVSELKRHRTRLLACKERVLTGEFGGAVGTLASVSEHGIEINARLMQELGLNVPEIAWHTARDNFAEFSTILSMVAATLGKIAHEIIDLQKLEFGEVEEPFEMGKVGSSTMPQKRNPMICEAILALARLARTQATTAIDAMMHEHERDWSSFQMEWAYIPELCVMVHGALQLSLRVLRGLIVYPENMTRNLNVTRGSLLAERVMLTLGIFIGRQHAYDIIYESAMESFEKRISFADFLKRNPAVIAHLSSATIDSLLDPAKYTGLAGVFVDRATAG